MTFCCHWGLFNGTEARPSLGVKGKYFGILSERRRRHTIGPVVIFIPDSVLRFYCVIFDTRIARRFIKRLFGHTEGINCSWHTPIEIHLGYDL